MFKFVFGRVGGCGLSELAGSCCVLFLQEQVRDLRVQKFLRELIVGTVVPSDLAGSFIVKIFYYGEGGDLEKVARTLK